LRQCSNGHTCTKPCGQLCGSCETSVSVDLSCGHTVEVSCFSSGRPEILECPVLINKALVCGHDLKLQCGSKPTSSSETTTTACGEPCTAQLDCGHLCSKLCHLIASAEFHLCLEACGCYCDRGHPCTGTCGHPCPPCNVVIDKILACSHTSRLLCSQDTRNVDCSERCQNTLVCGHPCRSLCYEPCDAECRFIGHLDLNCGHKVTGRCSDRPSCEQPCPLTLDCGHACSGRCGERCPSLCSVLVAGDGDGDGGSTPCSHSLLRPCYSTRDGSTSSLVDCVAVCGAKLSCQHYCSGICSKCTVSGVHAACTKTCTRRLVCGHTCTGVCGQLCSPCNLKSLVRCPHAKTTPKCGELAKPCKEKCTWRCVHKKCTKKCGAPCNRTVCDEKCDKLLVCGHSCAAHCGELCICSDCGLSYDEFPVFNLGCRGGECRNTSQSITNHNSERVGLFECPRCGEIIPFSHPFKQMLETCLERVGDLNNVFFSRTLKIKERSDDLVDKLKMLQNINIQELKTFCDKTVKLLQSDSKKLMSSHQLSMLELQTQVLEIISSEKDLIWITLSISGRPCFNQSASREVIGAVKKKRQTVGAENVFSGDVDAIVVKLENIEVFCYQARPFTLSIF